MKKLIFIAVSIFPLLYLFLSSYILPLAQIHTDQTGNYMYLLAAELLVYGIAGCSAVCLTLLNKNASMRPNIWAYLIAIASIVVMLLVCNGVVFYFVYPAFLKINHLTILMLSVYILNNILLIYDLCKRRKSQ